MRLSKANFQVRSAAEEGLSPMAQGDSEEARASEAGCM